MIESNKSKIKKWVKDKKRFSTTTLCYSIWPDLLKRNKNGALYHPMIRQASNVLKTINFIKQDKNGVWENKF